MADGNKSRRAYAIVDMYGQGKDLRYTLITLLINITPDAKPTKYDWKVVKCSNLTPEQVYLSIANDNKEVGNRHMTLINFKFDNNKKPVGVPASFNRFSVEENTSIGVGKDDPRFKAWVALSKLTLNGHTLGYRLIARNTDNGQFAISLRKTDYMRQFGEKYSSMGLVPVQNLRYMKDGKCFATYPNSTIIEEEVINNEMRRVRAQKQLSQQEIQEKNKKVNISDLYNADQIRQLQLGKQKNIPIQIYKDPKFSATQMEILRKALEKRIDVRAIANPSIDADVMEACVADMKTGNDLTKVKIVYDNIDKYTVAQFSSLSLAYDMGLDLTTIADPNIPVWKIDDMIELLDRKTWKSEEIAVSGDMAISDAAFKSTVGSLGYVPNKKKIAQLESVKKGTKKTT